MKKNITTIIQRELTKLTNKKFSKKYISNYILPIINFIINSEDNKYIISGSQGAGKTTLSKLFKIIIEKIYNKKVMLISIDDYYLDKSKRYKLAKTIHPLLITRGVPGTHNIKKLQNNINQFKKRQFPIVVPTFNKLKDNISKKNKIIKNAQILILEGWCCGAKPINKRYLYKNINNLETTFDKDFKWRNYYNLKLKFEYQKIFSMFDKKIYIQSPSFKNVLKWRYAQEKKNATKINKKNFMNKKSTEKFIQYYEKLTKWMMKNMPEEADMLLKIDKNQKIKKLLFKIDMPL